MTLVREVIIVKFVEKVLLGKTHGYIPRRGWHLGQRKGTTHSYGGARKHPENSPRKVGADNQV